LTGIAKKILTFFSPQGQYSAPYTRFEAITLKKIILTVSFLDIDKIANLSIFDSTILLNLKHPAICLKEIKAKMEKVENKVGTLKALIVDDSTTFRKLLKETLHDRFSSIEIYEAADGEEALQKIESLHPNLIFMDYGLPGENGLELAQKVKGRYPKIIVFILTGYDLREYRESSSRNADYVLLKDLSSIENIPTLVESILLNPL